MAVVVVDWVGWVIRSKRHWRCRGGYRLRRAAQPVAAYQNPDHRRHGNGADEHEHIVVGQDIGLAGRRTGQQTRADFGAQGGVGDQTGVTGTAALDPGIDQRFERTQALDRLLEWNFSRAVWKVPSNAAPISPPRLLQIPNITEKLTRLRGLART